MYHRRIKVFAILTAIPLFYTKTSFPTFIFDIVIFIDIKIDVSGVQ